MSSVPQIHITRLGDSHSGHWHVSRCCQY